MTTPSNPLHASAMNFLSVDSLNCSLVFLLLSMKSLPSSIFFSVSDLFRSLSCACRSL